MVGNKIIANWLIDKGWQAFPFQEETWRCISQGKSGLVNAPTGCGKTYAVFIGALIKFINENPTTWKSKKKNGIKLIWVSPLRALAKDIGRAMEEALEEIGLPWKVGIRNGDTTTTERQKQKTHLPEILIITPESLHLLLSGKNHTRIFENLEVIAVDEWHELLGSKRGVQVELALSNIIHHNKNTTPSIWGISATIGNLEEAKDVLLSPILLSEKITLPDTETNGIIIKAYLEKEIEVIPIFPEEVERYPWAGHLGIKLAHEVIPIIEKSQSTLIFINTRGMSETWYQTILNLAQNLLVQLLCIMGALTENLGIGLKKRCMLTSLRQWFVLQA